MQTTLQPIDWKALKPQLEGVWKRIPKPFRTERSIHGVLQCCLYGILQEAGYLVVADYMPPRLHDRGVDLIALDQDHKVVHALCLDTVIPLAAVKGLASFEARHKIIITTGALEKKVQESRFFLKPEIEHLHLQPFDNFR
jgi:hypothetical protein